MINSLLSEPSENENYKKVENFNRKVPLTGILSKAFTSNI